MSSWPDRADAAEQAVRTRHLRRLWALPYTRLGRKSWPAGHFSATWHYWWQAHLLDCALDAYQRAPSRSRHRTVAALVRGIRIRNLTSWVNGYYDDIAWLGLALQRAAALAGVRRPGAEQAIARRLRAGVGPTGGMRWRVGDDFINVPATGPAAIFFARRGDLELAASLADWIVEHLIDPGTGLALDGLRVHPDGSVRTVERAVYTYCQGVLLGACIELATSTGEPRWSEQADRTVRAVAEHLTDSGVLRGQGGGDGGLFAGILARYLALAATRRPAEPLSELSSGSLSELSSGSLSGLPCGQIAARLVLDSAEAAWSNRGTAAGCPLFGPQWTVQARPPGPSLAECDMSVQLSGWMLVEAAAELGRALLGRAAPRLGCTRVGDRDRPQGAAGGP